MSATNLFLKLFEIYKDIAKDLKWPGEGSFEVIIGAILVQNTAWKNVEKALLNLKNADALDLDGVLKLSVDELAILIKPSGFYNTKAKRLNALAKAIKSDFGDFYNFKESVSRDWLLGIKGIGEESCDAILCYACDRAYMVVDSYALRILNVLGYEFESYEQAQEWLSSLDFVKIYKDTNLKDECEVFKIFHALVLEFCKEHSKSKKIDQSGILLLKESC